MVFGAYIQASVVNWNKICFLSRSSDVRKEHVQLLPRAGWGGARAAQEPSALLRACNVMAVKSVTPYCKYKGFKSTRLGKEGTEWE